MNWNIIVAPLIGGVIGYITNDIAIKMLFHPRKPVYMGKWHIPLTPGLIPKERNRIAKSIGKTISTQLLDQATLTSVLLSEKMMDNLSYGIKNLFEKNKNNENTVREVVLRYMSADAIDNIVQDMSATVSSEICKKINSHDFKTTISDGIFEIVKSKISDSDKSFGFLASFVDDSLIQSISNFASEIVTSILKNNSKPIVDKLIDSEISNIENYKIKDILANNKEKLDSIIEVIESIYRKLVTTCLPEILEKLDIGQIIEDKISSFDVIELENMIFGIMKKELKAIVYLGAVLGFLMGFINILF